MNSFEGSTFIVAGAGGGIGRAAAILLAKRGAKVLCLDSDEKRCRETADQIAASAGDVMAMRVDVTNPEMVAGAVELAMDHWSDLTGLINCVGITGITGVNAHEVSLENFRLVLDVNLVGAFILTQAVLPTMVEEGYGRILHVASISGKEGNAGMASYSASKAGLIGLVKSLGKEYAQQGITINALAPAVIWTSLVEAMPKHQVDYMTERIPMGRLGTTAEAAELIAWIVSSEASFTTGFCFDLSGGRATY
jgi:3-oxoacyl-[acyl-carrier protein] reductase